MALPLFPLVNRVLLPLGYMRLVLKDEDGKLLNALKGSLNEPLNCLVYPCKDVDSVKSGQELLVCAAQCLKINATQGKAVLILFVRGTIRAKCVFNAWNSPTAFTPLPDFVTEKNVDVDELSSQLLSEANLILQGVRSQIPYREIKAFMEELQELGQLADFLAGVMDLNFETRVALLKELDPLIRAQKVQEYLKKQSEALQVTKLVQNSVRENLSKKQKEFILRQQLEAIKKELGETEGMDDNDESSLSSRLEKTPLPDNVKAVALKELKRLKRTPQASAEYSVIRNYLDWLFEMPWLLDSSKATSIDLKAARQQLETDHYGLDKVKQRIMEYLAVLQLTTFVRGPIICLAGPPGVGKTSLGKSIAQALGRRFVRISLGGIRDESEIRGHRRTYVGAMPGRIAQALRRCGVANPVMLLDEIDKVGTHNHLGDPSSALLEVLDPEQNDTFTDHYLNLPLNLSNVLFICTANRLDFIPPPLLDRLEVITLPGYTIPEKIKIARDFLLPKQSALHGVKEINLVEGCLEALVAGWTRESGVRELERILAAICRNRAILKAETSGNAETWRLIRAKDLTSILGPEKYDDEIAARKSLPGIATGLVYTGSGSGSILFLECQQMPGNGQLILTGQLGQILQESAKIALSWVRSQANLLGISASDDDESIVSKIDVHLHCPAGAIPKDGPSAGVAIVAALVSLFTKQPIPADLGMTGEVTLRGLVLPVGGIKEKLVGAHRAGLRRIILPAKNRREVEHEVPQEIKQQLDIVYVESLWEVLAQCFPKQSYLSVTTALSSHFDFKIIYFAYNGVTKNNNSGGSRWVTFSGDLIVLDTTTANPTTLASLTFSPTDLSCIDSPQIVNTGNNADICFGKDSNLNCLTMQGGVVASTRVIPNKGIPNIFAPVYHGVANTITIYGKILMGLLFSNRSKFSTR